MITNRQTANRQALSFFEGCDRRQMQRVAELATHLTFKAGSTITRRGNTGEDAVVVCSGTVVLDRDGETITTATAGTVVAAIAPLAASPAAGTTAMHALSDCELMVFSRREFNALDVDLPHVAARIRAAAPAPVIAMHTGAAMPSPIEVG